MTDDELLDVVDDLACGGPKGACLGCGAEWITVYPPWYDHRYGPCYDPAHPQDPPDFLQQHDPQSWVWRYLRARRGPAPAQVPYWQQDTWEGSRA